jgi:hypothetical protein
MTQFKSRDWQKCKDVIKERIRHLFKFCKKNEATWGESTMQVILVLLGNPEDVRFK